MRKIIVRIPIKKIDRATGQERLMYANYQGDEQVVNEGEKRQRGTARLILIESKRGKQYFFRVFGNGRYEMSRDSEYGPRVLARGTMMDRYAPEVVPVYI